MRKKSAEILESWREKAREESEYEFPPRRIVLGPGQSVANPKRTVLEVE